MTKPHFQMRAHDSFPKTSTTPLKEKWATVFEGEGPADSEADDVLDEEPLYTKGQVDEENKRLHTSRGGYISTIVSDRETRLLSSRFLPRLLKMGSSTTGELMANALQTSRDAQRFRSLIKRFPSLACIQNTPIRSNLTPYRKSQELQRLIKQQRRLAAIGDGCKFLHRDSGTR